jgi:hypothetical protein
VSEPTEQQQAAVHVVDMATEKELTDGGFVLEQLRLRFSDEVKRATADHPSGQHGERRHQATAQTRRTPAKTSEQRHSVRFRRCQKVVGCNGEREVQKDGLTRNTMVDSDRAEDVGDRRKLRRSVAVGDDVDEELDGSLID